MDFSRLPDSVLLKIFDCFPLQERIRLGHVNKAFRRIAQMSISRTKSLDLDEARFRNLNADQLAAILNLCSPNLQRFKIGHQGRYLRNHFFDRPADFDNHDRDLVTTLANYECPQLKELDIGHTTIDDWTVFDQLIRKNENMETMVWKREFIGYPPNIFSKNLKKLNLHVSNDAALHSLIDRFPNLKQLELRLGPGPFTANVLNRFFSSIPQVNHVSLDTFHHGVFVFRQIMGNEVANFCNLPLTALSVRLNPPIFTPLNPITFIGDDVVKKLATSFPHLQKLHLDISLPSSNNVISALETMRDLEILELDAGLYPANHDEGIRGLVDCTKLRKLNIGQSVINAVALVDLFTSYPSLEYVAIRNIPEISSSEWAAVVLESLAGIKQRQITIDFCSNENSAAVKGIWDGEPVKETIKKLEETDGLKIKIGFDPSTEFDRLDRRWF